MKRTAILSFSKNDPYKLRLAGGSRINIPKEGKDRENVLTSFGIADYYPEANAENVKVKEEDFFYQAFRLLSATIVGAGTWKATDFSNEAVLKKAMKLAIGKPVYKDHRTNVDNAVGTVASSSWSNRIINTEGDEIPAGINGVLKIDTKTSPKIARDIETGAVNSNSVTVYFDWEPSHEFEEDWQFYEAIGRVIDGKMVTRVVTEIYDIYETSLVWLGADPFAKKIVEGEPKNIDITAVFKDETDTVRASYEKEKTYEISEKTMKITFNKNQTDPMEKLFGFIAKKLGIIRDELTEEKLSAHIASDNDLKKIGIFNSMDAELKKQNPDYKIGSFVETHNLVSNTYIETSEKSKLIKEEKSIDNIRLAGEVKNGKEEIKNLTSEIAVANTKVEAFTKSLEELTLKVKVLEPLAKSGESFIKDKREETARLYSLSVSGKDDEAILGIIKNADLTQLDALLNQYSEGAVKKFSPVCKSCNSTDISMRSTFVDISKKKLKKETSLDDIRNKY